MVEDKIQFVYKHFRVIGGFAWVWLILPFMLLHKAIPPNELLTGVLQHRNFQVKLAALTLATDTTLHFRNALTPAPPLPGTSLNDAPCLKFKLIMALCFCHHQNITSAPMSFTQLFYQVWRMLM